jgi:hypothetical protein
MRTNYAAAAVGTVPAMPLQPRDDGCAVIGRAEGGQWGDLCAQPPTVQPAGVAMHAVSGSLPVLSPRDCHPGRRVQSIPNMDRSTMRTGPHLPTAAAVPVLRRADAAGSAAAREASPAGREQIAWTTTVVCAAIVVGALA